MLRESPLGATLGKLPGPKAWQNRGMTKPAPANRVHVLRIRLEHIEPSIWRLLVVPGDFKLDRVARIILAAMGWHDSHLHQFNIDGVSYAELDPEGDARDEHEYRLSDVVRKKGAGFEFIYDFGDYWEHEVTVERILQGAKGLRQPICLDGRQACPPEDVGSVPGYYRMLEALGDPDDEEHEEYLLWTRGGYDPAKFDLVQTNVILGLLMEEFDEEELFLGRM
jgi:hypothetical protein